MGVYDVNGADLIHDTSADFAENMYMWQGRNTTTGTNYFIIRIFKKKKNGDMQYPFLYAPNGTGAGTQSTLQMNMQRKFPFAVNAGIFDVSTVKPIGTLIQNGVKIQQGESIGRNDRMVLTVDRNGDLGYAQQDDNADTMIANGIISAVLSFIPLVINYRSAEETIESTYFDNVSDAQRQVIGQFGNGDYCIITAEARGFEASTGFTVRQVIQMCIELGLKYAFQLDGGGSAETVADQKQINPIYEGTYGRVVPNYLVFTGTDQFAVPN